MVKHKTTMTKSISYPGTDHKFMVTSTQLDFQLTEDKTPP